MVALGCKRKAPESDPVAENPATTAAAPEEVDPARAAPAVPEVPEPGQACEDDRQCTGYLRCEEGTCKVPPAIDGRDAPSLGLVTFETPEGEELASFKVELAVPFHERQRGLMYRRKLADGFGMLFVFPDVAVRSFWMKNTYIPLDMVHIDGAGKVVGVVANAEPMTTTPRQTGEPARYVLELNDGVAAEKGIVPGVKMSLDNVPEPLLPQ